MQSEIAIICVFRCVYPPNWHSILIKYTPDQIDRRCLSAWNVDVFRNSSKHSLTVSSTMLGVVQ